MSSSHYRTGRKLTLDGEAWVVEGQQFNRRYTTIRREEDNEIREVSTAFIDTYLIRTTKTRRES